ncbi:MAG: DUF1232 domain-containing protein [Erysipelotrichales bacterium]|nr:DUF1232 domain-containing protein [Erysipelotrichales bacterium]MBQ2309269.1 DUF1232 domain-containing protein [Erysipelotrichales bacterium]MBQ4011486.1 DUF1232 domain-containing protein [Erysipelotrichales bacterium]MBQ4374921.1 DUF1232 domain-containing protein [Erysipelotrichales bacterium]MBQ5542673.1 DUF1232 domain-containing protein [Erysipelotrichales bacterium]
MESFINLDKVKEALENGTEQAAALLKDNETINNVMTKATEKIKQVPGLYAVVEDIPVMASMIKSYITKEYSAVSPKVVALLVSAFLYLVRKKDLVSDNIPVIGLLDDVAVMALAVKLSSPELKAYKAWKEDLKTVSEEKVELHL